MPDPFVNPQVEEVVAGLRWFIESKFRDDRLIAQALDDFTVPQRVTPSIVPWIATAISLGVGCTREQILLILLATFTRSTSTYTTTSLLPSLLAGASLYELASIINDNAIHEAGTRRWRSHPLMLLDAFAPLCRGMNRYLQSQGHDATGTEPLTPAVHAVWRQLSRLRIDSQPEPADAEAFRQVMFDQQRIVPPFTDEDLRVAKRYAVLADGLPMSEYHTIVMNSVCWFADGSSAPRPGRTPDPTSRTYLLVQALEFAIREAGSADIGDILSYVGAFGTLMQAYLGLVDEPDRATATKWTDVHSDEMLGVAMGWGATAEVGHARDARILLDAMLDGIDAAGLLTALEVATETSKARLRHWDAVVERLDSLGRMPGAVPIPFCPVAR